MPFAVVGEEDERAESVVWAEMRVDGMISPMQTVAPRVRRREAVARPIPLAPPVMAMTLPCIDILRFCF